MADTFMNDSGLGRLWSKIKALLKWDNISDKPSTFTPSSHTHAISEVEGLQDALASKAFVSFRDTTETVVSGTETKPTAVYLPTLDVGELCCVRVRLKNTNTSKEKYYDLYTPKGYAQGSYIYQGKGIMSSNSMCGSGSVSASSSDSFLVFLGRITG